MNSKLSIIFKILYFFFLFAVPLCFSSCEKNTKNLQEEIFLSNSGNYDEDISLQMAYKEQTIAELKKNNIQIVIISCVVILLMIIFFFCYKRKKDLQSSNQLATIAGLKMKNVRSRISPHFMFNVLNAVLPFLRQHDELVKPLHLLVQAIRNDLFASEKISISLQEEIDMVQNYIELRKCTNDSNIRVEWAIDATVDTKTLIPSMFIQIPVENALKYAFQDLEGENLISIQIHSEQDFLQIKIEDNGVGVGQADISEDVKGTGNGLKILVKTIDLLNTSNNRKINFTLECGNEKSSKRRGTLFSVLIPFNYKYEI